MSSLAERVAAGEQWLIERVLAYARARGYTRYTATQREAWRASIEGLSRSLLEALQRSDSPPELGPDDDFVHEPIAAFGVLEAQRHRARGVPLPMFLGLMKYYRQAYLDLVIESAESPRETARGCLFVDRFFDRVELGFLQEWCDSSESARVLELQDANRRLEDDKGRYVTVFQSITEPVVLLDRQGRVAELNRSADDLLRFHPGDVAAWLPADPQAAAGRAEPTTVERSFDTPRGTRLFRIRLERMLDVSERFSGTLALFEDVTDVREDQARQEYRRALSELVAGVSAHLVGAPADHTDDTVEEALGEVGRFTRSDSAYLFRFSSEGRFFSMTHLWQCGLLTTTKEQLQNLDTEWMPWYMGLLRRGDPIAIRSLSDFPPAACIERDILERQGIHSVVDVPLVYGGAVVGFMGMASRQEGRDWNADEINLLRVLGQVFESALRRRRVEDALATERNLLRTLIDNLPDYIYAKDLQSRFILNNKAHLRVLHAFTAEEVVGKTDLDVFPASLARRYYEDERHVFETGTPLVNREESTVNELGEPRWVLSTKVPIHDADGAITGLVGITHDITERRQMEAALERHSQLLERANADLQARNRELDEFSYVASHDLQEPLRKIIAFTEALREDLEAGNVQDARRDEQVIVAAAHRMQRLVQDLLALSRSGRQGMVWADVPLDECLADALDALDVRVRESNAQIAHAPLPTVRGDRRLLTQLFQNLMGNALKFVTGAAPRVDVAASRQQGHWLIEVVDNGIGLKPEYAEQIFMPFRRLHRRDEYEGTGIGLAVCRKIVERHGGRIWVESQPGQGARFRFTLGETEVEELEGEPS